jgi:hypothetical protein
MASLTLNDFVSVQGLETNSLQTFFVVTQTINRGQDYVFRYRGVNLVGAGEWSDMTIVKAATTPLAPP